MAAALQRRDLKELDGTSLGEAVGLVTGLAVETLRPVLDKLGVAPAPTTPEGVGV